MMLKPASIYSICSICCGHFPVPTLAHSCSTVIALQLADFTAGRYVPVLPSRGRPLRPKINYDSALDKANSRT